MMLIGVTVDVLDVEYQLYGCCALQRWEFLHREGWCSNFKDWNTTWGEF
jgi:hypothetical protein